MNKKKKKLIIISIMIFTLLTLTMLMLFVVDLNRIGKRQLPKDLYDRFDCGRNTLDARSTDKYCIDYDLYLKDKAEGKIQ